MSSKTRLNKILATWTILQVQDFCNALVDEAGKGDQEREKVIEVLTYLNDTRMPLGQKKRAWVLNTFRDSLTRIFDAVPGLEADSMSLYKRY